MKNAIERFVLKFEISDEGCWEWQGARDKDGYGIFGFNPTNRASFAHRVSWELLKGTIPKNFCVCHHCDNPPCVRPSHLFLGTQMDNFKDMISKNRKPIGLNHHNGKKILCKLGHPLYGNNLYRYPNGRRNCRICKSNHASISYLKLKKTRGIFT